MSKEIEQLSDEELLEKYDEYFNIIPQDNYEKDISCEMEVYNIKQELLRRLSNNNVEEYKKKLVEKIDNYFENCRIMRVVPNLKQDILKDLIN